MGDGGPHVILPLEGRNGICRGPSQPDISIPILVMGMEPRRGGYQADSSLPMGKGTPTPLYLRNAHR